MRFSLQIFGDCNTEFVVKQFVEFYFVKILSSDKEIGRIPLEMDQISLVYHLDLHQTE